MAQAEDRSADRYRGVQEPPEHWDDETNYGLELPPEPEFDENVKAQPEPSNEGAKPEPPKGQPWKAYRFNPQLEIDQLKGLERLRAIPDHWGWKETLYNLHNAMVRNERDPEFGKALEREKLKREHERLKQLANAAFGGRYGKDAAQLAQVSLVDGEGKFAKRRDDHPALKSFEADFHRLMEEVLRSGLPPAHGGTEAEAAEVGVKRADSEDGE